MNFSEIKLAASEFSKSDNNGSFDIDKRAEISEKQNTDDNEKFDVDKRAEVEKDNDIGTLSSERKEFAAYSDGEWIGEVGHSIFTPNSETAMDKLSEYEQKGIEYKDGNPDFSKCSEATVEIDNMTSYRANNFRQANIACAEKWNIEMKNGRNDWTPQYVDTWRQENHYSWHERIDMKTMDLVPRDIHEECKHYGGVAECKRFEAINDLGGVFDD